MRDKTLLEIATGGSEHRAPPRARTPRQIRALLEPKESDSQKEIFAQLWGPVGPGPRTWAGMTHRWPELKLAYAINPNKGGNNSRAARGLAKAMGLNPGVLDMCLPAARGPFHGLYLEGKKETTGRLSSDQEIYANQLRIQGYCVGVWRNAAEGLRAVMWYLQLPPAIVDLSENMKRMELMERAMKDLSR